MIKLKPIQITWELSFDAFAARMLFTISSLILLTNLGNLFCYFNLYWFVVQLLLMPNSIQTISLENLFGELSSGLFHNAIWYQAQECICFEQCFCVLISHKNGKLSMQCSFWATKGTSHIEVIFAFVFKLDIFFLKLRKRKS